MREAGFWWAKFTSIIGALALRRLSFALPGTEYLVQCREQWPEILYTDEQATLQELSCERAVRWALLNPALAI
jgi:hypothetical protein